MTGNICYLPSMIHENSEIFKIINNQYHIGGLDLLYKVPIYQEIFCLFCDILNQKLCFYNKYYSHSGIPYIGKRRLFHELKKGEDAWFL